MALTITQPIDMDPTYNTIRNHFGTRKFSLWEASRLLGCSPDSLKGTMRELRDTLSHCPEGEQLVIRRGAGVGGHQFVPPSE
jgi:hypothetical protein